MKRVAWALLFVWGAGIGCSSSTSPAKSGAAGASGAAGGGTSGNGGTTGIAGSGGLGGTGSGGAGITGSGGSGGTAAMEPPSKNPVILSYTASPANLPAGGGMVTLTWNVQQATTLSIDQNVGAVTGTSTMINVAATTIFTLTATNSDGMTTATTAAVIGQNPSSMGNRYAAMIAPAQGESFAAPATLRVFAAGHDPLIDTNKPSEGLGGNASKVQFFVDDALALEVDGANAEYWVFKGFITGVAAGMHRVSARAIYTNPDLVLDSPPVLITVTTPTYDKTVTLTADVTLSGATGYELIGSADKRVKLDGNGHSISSADGATGPFTLKFVDVYDLGDATDTSKSAVDVTTSGAVTIEDSIVDTSNSFNVGTNGAASIQRNLFRSNMRQPLGQAPRSAGTGPSYPAMHITGTSTMPKTFASNNIGAGWIHFENASNWTVGGDVDAASNIAIGARAGIWAEMSANMLIKRNYTHHVYYGGWSQGSNYELSSTPTMTVENNVINDSSWPVRGVACEFRYNLVVGAGHEFLWADSNASVHHNIFVGGQSDIASLDLINNPTNVQIYNNTIDGLLYTDFVTALQITGGAAAFSSNLILNAPHPPGAAQGAAVTISGGALTTDYNAFAGPQTVDYSDGRTPAHDLSFPDASGAQLTAPPTADFDLDEATIWNRTTSVRDILAQYRMKYLPKVGSPLIDKGDPAGGTGNDVGCVGAGTANAADLFGQL